MTLGIATSSRAGTPSRTSLELYGLDQKIRRLCGLFVFIKDSKIYLIHQSARGFLTTDCWQRSTLEWYLGPEKIELQMAEICVRYLLMDNVDHDARDHICSLLNYSADNWADHFRSVKFPNQKLIHWVNELYNSSSSRFHVWFPTFWKIMPYSHCLPMTPLHLAAYNGHQDALRQLISSGRLPVDTEDYCGMPALKWACEIGHSKAVKVLLCNGADCNGKGQNYGYALYIACEKGYTEIAQILIEWGADVDANAGGFVTTLHFASAEGHSEVVEVLLKKGANVNASGEEYGNVLRAASLEGHVEIVQRLLLENVADINAHESYKTALYVAFQVEYFEIVELLLENGACINASDGTQCNAFNEASRARSFDIVQ